jgi:predicted glutamine amidotransferase
MDGEKMGRLLGIVSLDVIALDRFLFSVPDSLSSLSVALDAVRSQADGWGAAVFDHPASAWRVERRALRSGDGDREGLSSPPPVMRGTVLLAHVLARSASASPREGMAPLRRGPWVFASDGRLEDRDGLRRTISPARMVECRSDGDAELVFAHLLSRLDDAGGDGTDISGADGAVVRTVVEGNERRLGLPTFLLSNGAALYAHRGGRSLHLLERHGGGRLLAVASEPLTDEAWLPVGERTLLRCTQRPTFEVAILRGSDPRAPISDVELPFTD